MPKPTYLLFLAIILLLSQSKLYQVVSLSRHGARFHVNQFGDGKDTKPLWGQLTAVGMRQHQRFGQILRKQYITNLNFLSPTYNKNQIQVYSTSFNRTLASIQSQLYGLYPPGSGPKITNVNKNLQIPPYSNKTDVEEQKYALPGGYQPIKIKLNQKLMYQNCPNYSKYQKQNFQLHSDEFNQMNVTYYPFFKKLAPMFNFSLTTASFYTMVRVMDVVNVDNYLGRALPFNFTQDDQTNVFHLANWYFYMASLDKNTIMLSSGKLQKIISVFDRRIQSPNSYPLKWTFLSGHDTDLFALHLALDFSSPTCIQEFYRKKSTTSLNCESNVNFFASNLIFELHSEDARIFYVKIRSNGKYVYLCGKKSTQCEYTIFKNQVKKSISTNIQDLCGKPLNTNEQEMKINLLSSILLLQKNKQKILSQF